MCDGIFLSVLSLLKHTDGSLNIYILTASVEGRSAIPPSFAARLRKLLREKNNEGDVILLDITHKFTAELPLANMDTRFTPLCMLRLFADTVSEIPEKILYLDADVLCNGNFRELYETDISSYHIAGVADRYGKWFFGNILLHNYLNSGVLLMNMSKIRSDGVFEKCREMCSEKKMFMPDQTALNKLAMKVRVSGRYNNQGKMKKDTVFKHFTTFFRFLPRVRAVSVKPWQVDKMHKELGIYEFDDIIKEYQRREKNEQRNTNLFYN